MNAERDPALPDASEWLIDGFNLLHAALLTSDERKEHAWWSRELRDRAVQAARVLARAEPSASVRVVFDGDDERSLEPERGRAGRRLRALGGCVDRATRRPEPEARARRGRDRRPPTCVARRPQRRRGRSPPQLRQRVSEPAPACEWGLKSQSRMRTPRHVRAIRDRCLTLATRSKYRERPVRIAEAEPSAALVTCRLDFERAAVPRARLHLRLHLTPASAGEAATQVGAHRRLERHPHGRSARPD